VAYSHSLPNDATIHPHAPARSFLLNIPVLSSFIQFLHIFSPVFS